MKLTWIEKWMSFWGYKYFVNYGTKEIHRLGEKHVSCRLHMVANGGYITEKRALKLTEKHNFNGCRYCWKEKNNG